MGTNSNANTITISQNTNKYLNKAGTNYTLHNLLPGILTVSHQVNITEKNMTMKHINEIMYSKCRMTHLSHSHSWFYMLVVSPHES